MDKINDAKSIDEVLESLNKKEETVTVPANWAYPNVYQQTVELNDRTVLNGFAVRSPYLPELYIHPEGTEHTYVELAALFGDPQKTQRIYHNKSENETVVYTGYSQLGSIKMNNTGEYTITMRKI